MIREAKWEFKLESLDSLAVPGSTGVVIM